MEVRLLIAAVRRRLLLIIAVGIVGALAGAAVAQSLGGSYRATARLLLDPTSVIVPGAQQFSGDPERFVGGQLGVLQSRATAERAAKSIGVTPAQVEAALGVDRVVGSDVVEVVGNASSAALARDVANSVAQSYVAQRREQSAAAVANQVRTTQADLSRLEDQIRGFPTTPSGPTARQQVLLNQYEQLLQRRLTLTAPGYVRDATAVLDPAVRPEQLQRVSPVLASAAGAALGLLLGTALAVLLEGRRPRVTSRPQAELLLGQRVEAVFRRGGSPRARGTASPATVQPARVLLALISANPVQGRRVIAVCASSATRDVALVGQALMALLADRGTPARLLDLDDAASGSVLSGGDLSGTDLSGDDLSGAALSGAGRPQAALSEAGPASRRRKDVRPDDLALGEAAPVRVRPRPAATGTVQQTVRGLPADVEVAVLVLPAVLDSSLPAEVSRWASDVVLVVPVDRQSEPELTTTAQLLAAGTAVVHPVFVAGRSRGRL